MRFLRFLLPVFSLMTLTSWGMATWTPNGIGMRRPMRRPTVEGDRGADGLPSGPATR